MTLNYEALKDMKFADFKAAFKEKTQWKKAKAVMVLIDYKIDGKKVPVVLPLRRSNELKKLHKQIKADKHPSNKIGGGLVTLKKGPKGIQFELALSIGSLSEELLLNKAPKLFQQLLKAELVVANSGTTTETPSSSDDSAQIQAYFQQLKDTAQGCKSLVVPKIKAGNITDTEKTLLEELNHKIEAFQQAYEQASPEIQKQQSKSKDRVEQQLRPFYEKLRSAINNLSKEEIKEITVEEARSIIRAMNIELKEIEQALNV